MESVGSRHVMISTNESLLFRLRDDGAHEAWREFFDAYWGAILRYARKLGLSAHQSEEVLQETMVVLMRVLPGFVYDPGKGRFRNFLLTIVHRKCLAVMRRAVRTSEVTWVDGASGAGGQLRGDSTTADQEALVRWRDSLVEEAIRRLESDPRLAENTFAVFKAYVLQQQPATEVARRFGLKENAVYQIRNRLLRRLKLDVARLMKNSGAQ